MTDSGDAKNNPGTGILAACDADAEEGAAGEGEAGPAAMLSTVCISTMLFSAFALQA